MSCLASPVLKTGLELLELLAHLPQWRLGIADEGILNLRQMREFVAGLETKLDDLRQMFSQMHATWEASML